MTATTYNPADQAAGIAHAEAVSALRFRTLGKSLTTSEKTVAGCAFEAGARYAREQEGQAAALVERIVGIVDLLLATGNKHMTIDLNPPPIWLSDARELVAKRAGGAE